MRTFKSKSCSDCHKDFVPRSASHVRCDPCTKAKKQAYNAAYRARNLEVLRELDRKRNVEKKEQRAEWGRKYREGNEELKARKQAYYQANRERIIAKEAARYAAQRERIAEVQREWREKNPEALRARHQRRRARKAGVETVAYLPAEIFERDGWCCRLCGDPLNHEAAWPAADSPSVDHIVPLVHGGADVPENVQAAHLGCNLRKGRKVAV